jgi:thiamine phosphate synthase YjbQ (UPF0047 family)
MWSQKFISLSRRDRGCHLITDDIWKEIQMDVKKLSIGLVHVFIQHTSASLTCTLLDFLTISFDLLDFYEKLRVYLASPFGYPYHAR